MKHYRKKLLSLFCAAAFTLSIAINSGAVVTPFGKDRYKLTIPMP